jgi:Endoribonuclease L-PSP
MPARDLRYRRPRLSSLGKDRPLLLARPGSTRARDHDVRRARPRSRHSADTLPISTIPIQLNPWRRKAPVSERIQLIAESEGATLRDCVRIVVYVTDMFRFRPIANKVQEELWGKGPYPPRTIVEVHRLNQDDILEVEGTFYAPVRK